MFNCILTMLSAVSAIASAISAVLMYMQTAKINKFYVNKTYHSKIFDDFLIYKLPIARQDIKFDDEGKLINTQSFVDELSNLRNNSLFYKYKSKEFYNDIKKQTQEIEDYVMNLGNEKTDKEEQSSKLIIINEKTERLYETISNNAF